MNRISFCVASGEVQRLGQQADGPSGGNLVLGGRQDQAKAKRLGMAVTRLLDDAFEDFDLFIGQGLVNSCPRLLKKWEATIETSAG
jgi:hypothetical protein